MKKSSIALLVASVVVGVLGLAGLIVGVGYYAIKGTKTHAPTPEQRKLVLSAASFAPFNETLDPKCETFKTSRSFDLSTEIEYEHDCEGPSLYVQSTAQISLTTSDARQYWLLMIGGYRAGLALAGNDLRVEPRENLVTFGDQRYGGVIKMGPEVVGNVFVIRQGRVVHTAMITGAEFETADEVRTLLGPLIEESKRQYGGAGTR